MPTLPQQFRTTPQPTEKSWASRQDGKHDRYSSSQWKRLRDIVIKRDCYLCKACGCVVSTEGPKCDRTANVDHIIPHNGDFNLFIDLNNLQLLCQSCHSRKTTSQDGGFGNA